MQKFIRKIEISLILRLTPVCIKLCLVCIQACIKLYFHTCIEHVKLTGQSQVCIQVDTSILGNQPGFKPIIIGCVVSMIPRTLDIRLTPRDAAAANK